MTKVNRDQVCLAAALNRCADFYIVDEPFPSYRLTWNLFHVGTRSDSSVQVRSRPGRVVLVHFSMIDFRLDLHGDYGTVTTRDGVELLQLENETRALLALDQRGGAR